LEAVVKVTSNSREAVAKVTSNSRELDSSLARVGEPNARK